MCSHVWRLRGVYRARSDELTDVVAADGVVYLWRLEVGADDGHVEPELVEDSRLLVAQVTLEGRLKVTEDGLQRVAVAVACAAKAQALRHVRAGSSKPNNNLFLEFDLRLISRVISKTDCEALWAVPTHGALDGVAGTALAVCDLALVALETGARATRRLEGVCNTRH